MTGFKDKIINHLNIDKNITSLDHAHEEFIEEFNNIECYILPKYLQERKEKLEKYNNSQILFDEKLEMKDQIKEIDNKIKELKNKKKMYFIKNSNYIFNYFEDKKNISKGTSKTRILDKFFNKNDLDNTNLNNITNINIQNYFRNINPFYLDINNFIHNTDICRNCNVGELIPIEHEGILVCNNCSKNIKFLIDNDKPSYKEPPKEVCFYAYKRINHFREILAQFQAKETTIISDDIIENIRLQIKKERLDIKTISNKKTKELLKKLKYNKYYEHIPFIKDKLGVKPPIMSQELEETLCNLFMDIQVPYAKYCPEGRINFLNYYYTIYKLCELLNQKTFLLYFPMLKDREKRIEQDEIWKNICEELNWKFIPTI
jgi:hypothetical protein